MISHLKSLQLIKARQQQSCNFLHDDRFRLRSVIPWSLSAPPKRSTTTQLITAILMRFADAPARAFRDAQGTVNLVVGVDTTRRWIGSSLDSVVHQCPIIYASHYDTQQMSSRYREWLLAPYTVDGVNVYTVIHNEWYGNLVEGSQCGANDQVNGWVNASHVDYLS